MKRLIIWLGLMFALMFVLDAQAASSKEEWDVIALYTMGSSATVYDLEVRENDAASSTDLQYVFTPSGSIPASAAVSPTGEKDSGKVEVAYWNGGQRYGYVDEGSYYYDAISVKASDGKTYKIPKRAPSSEALPRWSIALRSNGRVVEMVMAALNGGGESGDDSGEDEGGSSGWTPPTYSTAAVRWINEEGEEKVVSIETLGTARSVIRVGKETFTVPTADLKWDTEAPENKMIASVYAPKGGKAALRTKSSSKAAVIDQVQTNRIMLVMSTGKNWTKVISEGRIGFVKTSSLKFYPVGGVNEKDAVEGYPKPGYVSFRGKIKSRNTINIRMNGKNGSRILGDFIAGTPIMVFSQENQWSEIDVGGYRAFILTKYVTLEENLPPEKTEE